MTVAVGDRVRITGDRATPDIEDFRVALGRTGKVRRAGALMVYVEWDGLTHVRSYHCSWIVKA